MRVHATLARSEHINQSLDGENQHGNCEESCEEGGPCEEGSGEEDRREEGGAGQEGRSGQEGGQAAKAPAKKRTPNAAFMKAMTPSAALAAIIGDKPVPRTEVTKKVWEYIKKNNLQDAAKRTMINADAKLKEIFKKGQVSMFEMTKLINGHLS